MAEKTASELLREQLAYKRKTEDFTVMKAL